MESSVSTTTENVHQVSPHIQIYINITNVYDTYSNIYLNGKYIYIYDIYSNRINLYSKINTNNKRMQRFKYGLKTKCYNIV